MSYGRRVPVLVRLIEIAFDFTVPPLPITSISRILPTTLRAYQRAVKIEKCNFGAGRGVIRDAMQTRSLDVFQPFKLGFRRTRGVIEHREEFWTSI